MSVEGHFFGGDRKIPIAAFFVFSLSSSCWRWLWACWSPVCCWENISGALTYSQMNVLRLVSTLYVPCVATVAALWKEFGWKRAVVIAGFKIAIAIIAGGLAMRLLGSFGMG